jgi:segregation and condensation protein B
MEENNFKTMRGAEAVLFVYGEPMEAKKIAKILGSDLKAVKESLDELGKKYSEENSGLALIVSGDKFQIATKPEFSKALEEFSKEEFKEQLSPASLETLALIAYFGPLSRAQLDYYRGVNSSFILRSLLIRGLIERFSDSQIGQGYIYKASMDLLKYLGMSKIEELPEYEKFKSMAENIQL